MASRMMRLDTQQSLEVANVVVIENLLNSNLQVLAVALFLAHAAHQHINQLVERVLDQMALALNVLAFGLADLVSFVQILPGS